MARGRGFKEFLGIGVESTNGTQVAATSFLRVLSNTPRQDVNPQEDPELREEITPRLDYMSELAGQDIVLRANYEGHELLYHSLLGTYNFTDLTTAGQHDFLYDPSDTHDFIEGLSLWSTHGLPVGASGPVVAGCVPTRLVVEFNARDYMRESWTFEGSKLDLDTIPTPTFPSRLPILGRHAGNATVTISNVAVGVRSGSLTLETARDEDTYLYGNVQRPRAERIAPLRGTIEFECELDNTTNAGQDLLANLSNADPASGGPHTLTIGHETSSNISGHTAGYQWEFSGAFDIMGDQPSIQDNGLVRFTLRGTLVDESGSTQPTIKVVNSIQSQVTT